MNGFLRAVLFFCLLPTLHAQVTYEAYFPFDRYELEEDEQLRFSRFLAELNLNDFREVEVVGHTDSVGTDDYNVTLSRNRSEKIKLLLLRRGFNSVSLRTAYFGESRPKYQQRGELDLDRRVEVIFHSVNTPGTDLGRLGEKENEPILIPQLQFVSGQVLPRPYAWQALSNLKNALLTKQGLLVEIHGHVCCGPDVELSEQRADFVREALVSAGINGDRLTTRGFGNKKPLVEEKTEADRARNRRVEVVGGKPYANPKEETAKPVASWIFPLSSIGYYPGRATLMRNTEVVLDRLIDEALLPDTRHKYTFILYDQGNNIKLSELRLKEIAKRLERKKLKSDNFGWEARGKHPEIRSGRSASYLLFIQVTPIHGELF